MARLNDNQIGAISGAVRDMVSESTNRAMNGHSFPEAQTPYEVDLPKPRAGSKKYILAAVLFLVLVFFGFSLLFRGSDYRNTPTRWKGAARISSQLREQFDSVIDTFGTTLWLTEAEPGIWQIAKEGSGDRKLAYDNVITYYFSASDGLWFWYDVENTPNRWQCWYKPISGNYGDFGWIENRDGVWFIQNKKGKWIEIPEKYDTSPLWSVQ